MIVNRDVLIPRPETELLAELGWNFLSSLVKEQVKPCESDIRKARALDYGTGSGCLAVTLAIKCPRAAIDALDISPNSIEVARQNASQHGAAERICFWVGDGLGALPGGSTFDLIISNPPYIPSKEIQSLQPEVRDFDPRQALDGGPDGLDQYRRLAAGARRLLRSGGKLMLEIGDCQSDSVRDLLERQNWIVERLVEDYTHRPRIVIAHDKSEPQPQSQENKQGACDD
jgi:release factor glutamine methyltransferase